MARQPRFVVPGQPPHVIQRGTKRSGVFAAEEDYKFYLEKLAEGCREHECAVHAYALMTNHVHLLVTPQAENGIGRLTQFIGRCYVEYFYSYV